MGPELGCKSAGRCSYHQRGRCIRAAVGDHFVHQLFYAFSGFMDRKQLKRYECSGSTFAETNQFAFVITMGLFMSVGLAFATIIISIDFQFFYTTVLKILQQFIAIAFTTFFVHMFFIHTYSYSRSCCHCSGVRFRRPMGVSKHFRKRVTRPYPAFPIAVGQPSAPSKFSFRSLRRRRDLWGYGRRCLRGQGKVFLVSAPTISNASAILIKRGITRSGRIA